MAQKGLIGASVNIGQCEWHRPLLFEIRFIRNYYTDTKYGKKHNIYIRM